MSSEQQNRNDVGKRAGIVGIIANVLIASVKLVIGILGASMSIIADAINNFSDGISSVVTFISFKMSKKPADADHPFGHARFEYVSGLIVSILIIFVGFELAKGAIEKIISPTAINFSVTLIVVLGVSILGKLALCVYNSRVAKKLNSSAIRAAAQDALNDVIVTTVILIATIIEYFTSVKVDAYTGLAVAIFVLFSGIKLVGETISPILGKRNDERLKTLILEKIKEYPIVIGYHDLMIHDYGPGISFCSIHFEIDKNLDPLYVHEIIDKFEREFIEYGTSLTVHYDPVVTDSPELNALKHEIVSELVEIDNRLSIHDFRSIPCAGFTKLFFDIPLADDLVGKEKEIKERVELRVNGLGIGEYQAEITFDSDAFN